MWGFFLSDEIARDGNKLGKPWPISQAFPFCFSTRSGFSSHVYIIHEDELMSCLEKTDNPGVIAFPPLIGLVVITWGEAPRALQGRGSWYRFTMYPRYPHPPFNSFVAPLDAAGPSVGFARR